MESIVIFQNPEGSLYLDRAIRPVPVSYTHLDVYKRQTGRSPRVKKFIKSLYQFHLRPLWDAQNCFNLKAASAMNQMRNFVLQQIGQNEQVEKHLEELRKVCREQELRIEQLEKMLSEEKE